MDFVVDNLVWFIVGGIVIIMTIIGYFADKTDFGKKTKVSKPQKEEEKIVEQKEPEKVTSSEATPVAPAPENEVKPVDFMEVPVLEPLPDPNTQAQEVSVPVAEPVQEMVQPVVAEMPAAEMVPVPTAPTVPEMVASVETTQVVSSPAVEPVQEMVQPVVAEMPAVEMASVQPVAPAIEVTQVSAPVEQTAVTNTIPEAVQTPTEVSSVNQSPVPDADDIWKF